MNYDLETYELELNEELSTYELFKNAFYQVEGCQLIQNIGQHPIFISPEIKFTQPLQTEPIHDVARMYSGGRMLNVGEYMWWKDVPKPLFIRCFGEAKIFMRSDKEDKKRWFFDFR